MSYIGIAELMIVSLAILTLVVLVIVAIVVASARRQARRFGYRSTREYLRAVPRSEGEKRASVSLMLIGAVICLLGSLFPPFLLVGVFPLFFGARKVVWASMGLGLVDDADRPEV